MLKAPNGWTFHTADFSCQAAGYQDHGRVMLTRDFENHTKWHMMPEDLKESDQAPELYVSGNGNTLEEAFENAYRAAESAKPIETCQRAI